MAKNMGERDTAAVAARAARSSRARLAVGALALVAASGVVLAGCGNGDPASPQKVNGTAGPATDGQSPSGAASDDTGGSKAPDDSTTASGGQQQPSSQAPTVQHTKTSGGKSTDSGGNAASGSSSRCHTSELKASVGGNDPGAGQENFALVLTNTSGRTCTVYGFPGFAFVDGSGKQVSTDPQREGGSQKQVVSLSPGRSAWATLRFANPDMVGGATVTPAAVEITPPDEKAFLKATWSGGAVSKQPPNAAATIVGVFQPGTGPS
ncbi:DUF4232 domain-containing protein [Streptomyces fuscigenes]|uniref:DUF4232 domain-containing protein n=1 Tax=Streptomyces fuscigenes TaxID=1528880 RepID=UPI001F22D3C0|nr:DUF4232 domain-containing protein [Streptomyces fuscigenes]MCF3964625.1 DUF4232 domain-containing protein [Streptomyces fuscigenes]